MYSRRSSIAGVKEENLGKVKIKDIKAHMSRFAPKKRRIPDRA
jgi:hypothetical protein